MPTVLRWRGYRFLFYSKDVGEPPHIHIVKDRAQAKIWLHDLSVARSVGFAPHELTAIVSKTRGQRELFRKAWDDYFGS